MMVLSPTLGYLAGIDAVDGLVGDITLIAYMI